MRDWKTYTVDEVFKGSENGVRLIIEFSRDYQAITKQKLCVSCRRSFPNSFNQFLNLMGHKQNNTEYSVKLKYSSVSLPGYRNDVLSNRKMTEEKALHFLVNHPAGKTLFDKLPKDVDKRIKKYKSDNQKLTTDEHEPTTDKTSDVILNEEETEQVDIEKFNKTQLEKFASEYGIDLSEAKSNDDRKTLINIYLESRDSDNA